MVTLYSVYIYISIYGNVSNTEDKSLTRYTCQLCTYGNVGILCISEYVSNTEEREREREREKYFLCFVFVKKKKKKKKKSTSYCDVQSLLHLV
jgi:hypothetical protein